MYCYCQNKKYALQISFPIIKDTLQFRTESEPKPKPLTKMAFDRTILLLLLISLLSFFHVSLSSSSSDDPLIQQVVSSDEELSSLNAEHHFTTFIHQFGKTYKDEAERLYRLSVFKSNLRRAEGHQKLDPTAVHGVTKFSDLTPREFRKYMGLKKGKVGKSLGSGYDAPILPTNDLPEDFDWREMGAVTGVKNQGSCGSCWSFSTSGALEGANFLATGKLETLSEQQLVDCDHECDPSEADACDAGCNGGLMTTAFQYLLKSGGLERENDYPYTGSDGGKCKFDKSKIVASVKNFSVVSVDEDQIAANLVKHGPLARLEREKDYPYACSDGGKCKFDESKIVASVKNFSVVYVDEDQIAANLVKHDPLAIGINAVFMQTYIGGVSCPYICGKHLDHGVLLVGYGSAGYSPIRLKEKPYWIIKNSWGENWGESGYYKICRGRNVCGVDSMVSTVSAIEV